LQSIETGTYLRTENKSTMQKLIERQQISENVKTSNLYQQLNILLKALEEKNLARETFELIDQEIVALNSISHADKSFGRLLKEKENKIIRLSEKRHKVVPRNYYRKLWMILGMSAFGIPMGVAFGISLGNLGLLGLGLPIGMAVGVGVGSMMDKKALQEGRQLDFEVKY
jgi:ABC-type phosphate/phosphonate transport system permease subunit